MFFQRNKTLATAGSPDKGSPPVSLNMAILLIKNLWRDFINFSGLLHVCVLPFSVLQHCWPPSAVLQDNSFYDDSFHATYLPRFSHSAGQINHSLEHVPHPSPWHSIKTLMGPYCSSQETVVDQGLDTSLKKLSGATHNTYNRQRQT